MYTCYHKHDPGYDLCLATATDPIKGPWARHGAVIKNHKSGALLLRDSGVHFLISGAGKISISSSKNPLGNWTVGTDLITNTSWGNPLVEAGPPPLPLSDGNLLFFHNSWGGHGVPQPGYQPAWVVLDGKDPTRIVARASQPLWSPDTYSWMAGTDPNVCNVPQVAFLEAAMPVAGSKDTFRVFFGGADAVLGTAIINFEPRESQNCA
eukprot:TRINITY_DN45238_c0_g1_i2.p1 TRINITY_DN45238_c0_g1~~TRINITY_DN45238_c0_g1_i2.p1  ORF type:complete len:208 (+),score=26.82 TRINITY_DN45238_c0_g1_i2:1-624(+)